MENYKDLYLKLFNKVSDAIAALQAAQQECEARFVENEVEAIAASSEESAYPVTAAAD